VTGTLQPSPAAGGAGEPAASAPDGPAPARAARSRRPRLRLWLVAGVLLVAFAYLLVEGLGSSLDYFDTVDQALANRAALGTSSFRLEGVVVPGTIRPTGVGADFRVAEGSRSVPVENAGTPPQLFGPDIPVVVVGHFAPGSDTFLSDQVMVKHSANYIAGHPDRVKAPNGSVR
jgi:cytochrome c-type biogenesis protein CcmE